MAVRAGARFIAFVETRGRNLLAQRRRYSASVRHFPVSTDATASN